MRAGVKKTHILFGLAFSTYCGLVADRRHRYRTMHPDEIMRRWNEGDRSFMEHICKNCIRDARIYFENRSKAREILRQMEKAIKEES